MKQIVSYLIVFSFLLACTTRPITPTRESRRAIDTLYQQQVTLLQPSIDSSCKGLFDSVYAVAVDSILSLRIEEMNILVR